NKNTAILSGDRQETVKKVANNTGIKNIYAELNPDEKLEIVNKYKSRNAIVAAIGDGINDAPVLASAHVS
ncbi:MAG: HAD-IC family P-type ATPase, partial [Candidatus Dadabacteria bacterium]|nr:HAD-IC family P-type ATPase [Candidatus Dadabacteria bacterium]NIQ50682.1 HAD-IC family P-type ATPase [Hydrotalea flava]